MVDIARDPGWAGSSRAPARTRTSVRPSPLPSPRLPGQIIAGPKHFAGYGAALGGRDYDEVNLSDSELWNVYSRRSGATRPARAT